ncbi:MAG: metallophosphoesterase [Endomicrobia bacterium]|nr:metallophosphoesterase [Endomicrobiia bacterium]
MADKNVFVFGDIHGLTLWKNVVEDNLSADFVFLGDYLDPYLDIPDKILLDNLREIIKLKKDRPKNVVLLLGNHDLHYFDNKALNAGRFNYEIAPVAEKLFMDNRKLFQFAYQNGKTIFTHAGITNDWFINDFKGDIKKNIAKQLNNPKNSEQENTLYYASENFRGGLNENGGPFWSDICEIGNDPLKDFIQVVGHNRVEKIGRMEISGGKIIFCDCLESGNYLKI